MELERGTGMKKWKIMLPAVVAAGSLVSWPAYAHGFGERTELPVPLGYFPVSYTHLTQPTKA